MRESRRDGSGEWYVRESFLRRARFWEDDVPFQRIETWRRLALPSRAQGFLGEGVGGVGFLAEDAVERWCRGM
jgi:hypothetical protein